MREWGRYLPGVVNDRYLIEALAIQQVERLLYGDGRVDGERRLEVKRADLELEPPRLLQRRLFGLHEVMFNHPVVIQKLRPGVGAACQLHVPVLVFSLHLPSCRAWW